eukprot:4666459-Pleurochrysis_carterae.AAC.2
MCCFVQQSIDGIRERDVKTLRRSPVFSLARSRCVAHSLDSASQLAHGPFFKERNVAVVVTARLACVVRAALDRARPVALVEGQVHLVGTQHHRAQIEAFAIDALAGSLVARGRCGLEPKPSARLCAALASAARCVLRESAPDAAGQVDVAFLAELQVDGAVAAAELALAREEAGGREVLRAEPAALDRARAAAPVAVGLVALLRWQQMRCGKEDTAVARAVPSRCSEEQCNTVLKSVSMQENSRFYLLIRSELKGLPGQLRRARWGCKIKDI